MTSPRTRIVLAALIAVVLVFSSVSEASAAIWPGAPAPNGPAHPAGSQSGGGSGSGGTRCGLFNTGHGGGQLIFDPVWWGCFGGVYSAHQILFAGYEVWRFYGTANRATGATESVRYGTVSEMFATQFGRHWPFGYDFPAPHPTDAGAASQWGGLPSAFLAGWGRTEQGHPVLYNARYAETPLPPFRAVGSGDCRSLRTNYFRDAIRGEPGPERDHVLSEVRKVYLQTLSASYPAVVAANMANLRAVPANTNDLEAFAAVWEDGVPCTSTLEYARPESDPSRVQIVTCFIPRMRLGAVYPQGNSPYNADLGWRAGTTRYSDAYPDMLNLAALAWRNYPAHRTTIFHERNSRGGGTWQPYVVWAPLFNPGYNNEAAASAAARFSRCEDTTASVSAPQRVTVTQTIPSPAASVEITLDSPEVLQVGGSSRPANFATSTRLVCVPADCRAPGNQAQRPRTVLHSASHDLSMEGTEGYTRCATPLSRNCDWVQVDASGSNQARAGTAWFFRATSGDQRFTVTAANPTAMIRRQQWVVTYSCPIDYGGNLARCTESERTITDLDPEPVTPSLRGGPTSQRVVSATNDPGERR